MNHAWIPRRPELALLALLAAAVPASAEVLVVDAAGGPGVTASTIQAAVDVALEGDTILVRDGFYVGFTIDGKSLSVVADGPNVVAVQSTSLNSAPPAISVLNLVDGQEVVVRGLRTNFGVSVVNCDGAVWFDGLFVVGASLTSGCQFTSNPGADVESSTRVTFTRCTLVGEMGNANAFWFAGSAAGVCAVSSTLQLFDCSITGGDGISIGTMQLAQPGAPGLEVDGSTVTIVGCTIVGGAGGLTFGPVCDVVHPTGGAGVAFVGTPGTVQSAASTAVGGAADLGPLCPGQTGPQGPAISGTGTIVPLVGVARHLEANSPVRGGETLTFDVEGQAGEVPLVFVSLDHEPIPLLAFSGVLLVGLPPSDVFVLGALPASGQASLSFPVPPIGLVGALTYYAQGVFLDPTAGLWLGAGTTVTLLDPSF